SGICANVRLLDSSVQGSVLHERGRLQQRAAVQEQQVQGFGDDAQLELLLELQQLALVLQKASIRPNQLLHEDLSALRQGRFGQMQREGARVSAGNRKCVERLQQQGGVFLRLQTDVVDPQSAFLLGSGVQNGQLHDASALGVFQLRAVVSEVHHETEV